MLSSGVSPPQVQLILLEVTTDNILEERIQIAALPLVSLIENTTAGTEPGLGIGYQDLFGNCTEDYQ